MQSSRRAFTLIEVLISVVILSIVGVGLMQISINSKKNYEFLRDKSRFDRLSSIAFMHNSNEFHNQEKSLYRFIEDSYDDVDDEIRKYLDEIKVNYSQEEFSTLSFGDDENSTQNSGMNLTLIYEKISLYNKKNSTFAYKIYLPMSQQGGEPNEK